MSRLIDADKMKENINLPDFHVYEAMLKGWIDKQPTVNAIHVVRCKDCNCSAMVDGGLRCMVWEVFGQDAAPPDDGFCHCGVNRKKENQCD